MSNDIPGQTPDLPPAPATPPAYGDPQPSAYPPPPAAPAQPAPYGQPPQYAQPQYPQTPPYAQPQYPPAAYGAYGAYPVPKKTNVLAVISMIASIVGFIWILPFVGALAGVITGHIALKQIAQSGENGRGMALAGVIVGYVALAFVVIGVILFVFFLAIGASQSTRYA